jgi:glycosyltransferase involved in cell wall biosynthesis
MKPHVLHIIPNLVIGGAQRSVATLRRAPFLDSRVVIVAKYPEASISWADIVVVHAWRKQPENPDLNMPDYLQEIRDRPIIVFNHDWEGRYLGLADRILVYSKFAAAHWWGPQRIAILPGGITLPRFTRVAQSRNWSRVGVVGRLSTLHPGKISLPTLEYWPRIDATLFMIGGAGSQLTPLMNTCADPRFRFVGEISPVLTDEFLAKIDIFLYDTAWHVESFCYVILEALAAGCVVVASNRGAIGDLVQPGVNGFLFDVQDEAVELCNELLRDPEKCRVVSAAGAASAHRFPSEVMRSRFTAHIVEVLEERRH